MKVKNNPQLLARFAGVSYLAIIVFAALAYVGIRGRIVIGTDMARTISNLQLHDQLYRVGFSAGVITVLCNVALGLLLYELLKVVSQGLARGLLAFIMVSATIEAVNLYNYIAPLITATLPEYKAGFDPVALQALIPGSGKLFAMGFGISLAFFGIYCILTGYLIVRSTFLPRAIGVLMIAAGVIYECQCLSVFLRLPEIPYILFVAFGAELSLALWLLIMGVKEERWHEMAAA